MFPLDRRLRVALHIALDILLVNLAFALAYWMRYQAQLFLAVDPQFFAPFGRYAPLAALLTLIALPAYAMSGLYQERRGRRWLDEMTIIVNGTMTAIVLVISVTFLATYLVSSLVYSRLMFIEAAALVVLFLGAARLVRRGVSARLRRRGIGVSRALIVGAGEVGRTMMGTIVADPALGYVVAGFIDDDPQHGSADIGRFKSLGGLEEIPAILQDPDMPIDEVIITLPWSRQDQMSRIVRQCRRAGVTVRIVPDVFQLSLSRVDMDSLGGIPVLTLVTLGAAAYLIMQKRYRTIGLLLAVTLGGLMVSLLLKDLFGRPRPEFASGASHVTTASFPSGHSMLSAIVYLTLAALLARTSRPLRFKIYFLTLGLTLTILVGLSRIYLGVHYPTDVLAGWSMGLIWALTCWLAAYFLERSGVIERQRESIDEP